MAYPRTGQKDKDEGNTQWVCRTQPICTCSGAKYDCQCILASETGEDGDAFCKNCSRTMIWIDCDTGERLDT